MKRKAWVPAGTVLAAAAAVAGAVVASGSKPASAAAPGAPANTVKVERGALAEKVSLDGTLTFRARWDGSPYTVINQARGIYTKLPFNGDTVDCGDTLYRVNDHPVLLLCGTVPAYRDLHVGDEGRDVRQLNRNLHIGGDEFTSKTRQALRQLQRARGLGVTGAFHLDEAVFLPRAVRIADVTGELGGAARPGAPIAQATSNTLQVQVNLDPSQRGAVKKGDRAQVTLPSNTVVKGKVKRIGKVVAAKTATIPAYISLDAPKRARGFDRAPVQVDIATKGVENALSVPVTALVGKSGGGFAVEVVRDGTQRELVAVELGLFDTASGRVQVEGELEEGDPVVVPSL